MRKNARISLAGGSYERRSANLHEGKAVRVTCYVLFTLAIIISVTLSI